jgi:hypothetical protein
MKSSQTKLKNFPLYSYIGSYRATFRYLCLIGKTNSYLFDRYLISLLVSVFIGWRVF